MTCNPLRCECLARAPTQKAQAPGLPHHDHHLRADTLTLTNIPISYITRAWPVNSSF